MNILFDILLEFFGKYKEILLPGILILSVIYIIFKIIENKEKFKDFISIDEFRKMSTEEISGCYVFLVYNNLKDVEKHKFAHVYVGQSVDLNKRIKTHLSGNGCKEIYWDIRKQKIVKVKLAKVPVMKLDKKEKQLIKLYNAYHSRKGYNKTRGGGGYYGKRKIKNTINYYRKHKK